MRQQQSIPYGSWQPCTDSCLIFDKYSDEYKDAIWEMKVTDTNKLNEIESKVEPYLRSM